MTAMHKVDVNMDIVQRRTRELLAVYVLYVVFFFGTHSCGCGAEGP